MEERELPVGWGQAPLGQVCRLLNGRAYSKDELLSDGKYPLLRVGNLFTNPHWYYSDLELEPDKYCDKGDLLYAWSASFGPHVWQGPKVIYHYHIWKVEHQEVLIARDFLRSFFQWDTEAIKREQGSGSTMLHVTKKSMEARLVPVPPQAEQRRIAAKLETTLAAVDACRQRLEGVAELLKRFRQAVLEAATTGELTREWREESGNQAPWEPTQFGKVCDYITVGHVGKMADQYVVDGIPFLRSLNVRPFRFDDEGLAFISPEFHQTLKKSALAPGDLAVVRTGAPGQCCVIPESLPEANCSDLVIARPGPGLLPEFGALVINSSLGQGFVRSEQVGVAQAHFNVGSMKRAPLNLPPFAEQQEIVRRAQELFSLADHLEARLTTARQVVERLTPALLAKAFRGELVPQDPTDEPASVLLERIRAARQAESAASKPSRRGRTKAAANPAPSLFDAAPVPPDLLATLLWECGALSEKALLAASELEPHRFPAQLELEQAAGRIQRVHDNGQDAWVAVG